MPVVELCSILHKYRENNADHDNYPALRFITKRWDQDHSDAGYEDKKAIKK